MEEHGGIRTPDRRNNKAQMEEHGGIRTPDRRNNNHTSLKTPNSPRRRKMMNRKLNSSAPPTPFSLKA